MSPFMALLGLREMSDLSPQSGQKRTLIRSLSPIAILWVHVLIRLQYGSFSPSGLQRRMARSAFRTTFHI